MTTKEACKVLDCDERTIRRMLSSGILSGVKERNGRATTWNIDAATVRLEANRMRPIDGDVEQDVLAAIKNQQQTSFNDICNKVNKGPAVVQKAIDNLKANGYEFIVSDDRVEITTPKPGMNEVHIHPTPGEGKEIIFGALGDTHLGSKWERLDVLNTLYKGYAEKGITEVYHTGNIVEGDARFNKFDVKVYGIEAQTDYCLEHYPQIPGITTYFVTGDDHEGWWMQREGINYGKYLETKAVSGGRNDLKFIGHVEADVVFESPDGIRSNDRYMRVMHPGGGSSYAFSYKPQKIVEAMTGGEKPHICLIGHYHKFDVSYPREVWTVQTGCVTDQSMFMRKRQIQAHVGGCTVRMRQLEDGRLVSFATEFTPFYDTGYYERGGKGLWNTEGVCQT